MSSRYQKNYSIPEGFPALLKDFAREALRNQPESLYQFGADYFANLVEERAMAQAMLEAEAAEDPIPEMTDEDIHQLIFDAFQVADEDNNGYLDRKEFSNVLKYSGLNLTKEQRMTILAEADENDDGCIEYKEFVPIMAAVIQAIRAKEAASVDAEMADEDMTEEITAMFLRGYTEAEILQMIDLCFKAADKDASGSLSRQEFKDCLAGAEIGLSRKDINIIMSEVDIDGNVSYEEFMPMCFGLLVERFKSELKQNETMLSNDGLTQMLTEKFMQLDAEETGALKLDQCKEGLQKFSYDYIGLSNLQILAIISEAVVDANGNVLYLEFAPLAAAIIYNMVDLSTQQLRFQAVQMLAETEVSELLHGLSEETVIDVITEAFVQADTDGSGYLDRDEMQDIVSSFADTGLALSPQEVTALIASFDADDNGKISYTEMATLMLDILKFMGREDYIKAKMFRDEVEEVGEVMKQTDAVLQEAEAVAAADVSVEEEAPPSKAEPEPKEEEGPEVKAEEPAEAAEPIETEKPEELKEEETAMPEPEEIPEPTEPEEVPAGESDVAEATTEEEETAPETATTTTEEPDTAAEPEDEETPDAPGDPAIQILEPESTSEPEATTTAADAEPEGEAEAQPSEAEEVPAAAEEEEKPETTSAEPEEAEPVPVTEAEEEAAEEAEAEAAPAEAEVAPEAEAEEPPESGEGASA